jgi:hypothetical protein
MKTQHFFLALATFLIIIGTSGTLLVRQVTAQQIPALAWKCLPPPLYGKNLDFNKSEFLEGITEYEKATYLIVNMRYRGAPFFENQEGEQEYLGRFAIALEGGDCFNLNDPRQAADFIFSSRIPIVPEPVGKEIALQFWRRQLAMDNNNREKFKAELMKGFEPGPETAAIYPEDQWALKQLGIDVPLNEPDIAPMTYDGMWNETHGIESPFNLPRNQPPSGELFENERRQIQQIEKRKW